MSEGGNGSSRWSFDQTQYSLVQVVSLTKQDRPDGYDGRVALHVKHPAGQITDVTIEVRLQDYPWGNEWQADIAYEGWTPPLPDAAPVQMRFRTFYGQVHDGKRLDRTEQETRLRDGQRTVRIQEGRPVPNVARPSRTAEEYKHRVQQVLAGTTDETSNEGSPEDVSQEPLLWTPYMVGVMLTLGADSESPLQP